MWWVVLGVHGDVHGEWVMLWVAACNVQCTCYTEHDRCGLSCTYAETVLSPCMSSAGSVWYVWYVWYTVCMVGWSLSYVVKFYWC